MSPKGASRLPRITQPWPWVALNYTLGVAVPVRQPSSHHMPPRVTHQGQCHCSLRSKDSTDTLKAFQKKKKLKQLASQRMSHVTEPMTRLCHFGLHLKIGRNQTGLFELGTASAWQVCYAAHLAGTSHEGCVVLATCILASSGKS